MRLKALWVLSLLSLPLLANELDNKQLLPEVKQLLVIPDLFERDLDQNGYVGMLALDVPVDKNYTAIAKKMLIKNNRLLQVAISKQDVKLLDNIVKTTDYYDENKPLKVNMGYGTGYEFPCASLKNLHCVDKVIKDRKQLTALIKESNVILARYRQIQAKPYYKAYPMSAEMPIPLYHKSIYASQLRLAEAVFAIDDGDVRKGLKILQDEMDFIKNKLLVNGYLIDVMIGVRQLLITAHVLEQLIDRPQLKPYLSDPQITLLFQPLNTEQQQIIASTFRREQGFMVISGYFSTKETIEEYIHLWKKLGFDDNGGSYFCQAKKLGYPLRFNKIAAMNLNYQKLNLLISKASLMLPSSSSAYIIDSVASRQPLTIQEIYQQYGADNVLGGIMLESDQLLSYLYRFYDVNNYLWLIQAKLQIKRLAISKSRVVEFLLRSNHKNPYSQHSLQWNSCLQVLSSDWLGDIDDSRDGDRATIYIKYD